MSEDSGPEEKQSIWEFFFGQKKPLNAPPFNCTCGSPWHAEDCPQFVVQQTLPQCN